MRRRLEQITGDLALHHPGLWREQVHWASGMFAANLVIAMAIALIDGPIFAFFIAPLEGCIFAYLLLRTPNLHGDTLLRRPSVAAVAVMMGLAILPLACATASSGRANAPGDAFSPIMTMLAVLPLGLAAFVRCAVLFRFWPSIFGALVTGVAWFIHTAIHATLFGLSAPIAFPLSGLLFVGSAFLYLRVARSNGRNWRGRTAAAMLMMLTIGGLALWAAAVLITGAIVMSGTGSWVAAWIIVCIAVPLAGLCGLAMDLLGAVATSGCSLPERDWPRLRAKARAGPRTSRPHAWSGALSWLAERQPRAWREAWPVVIALAALNSMIALSVRDPKDLGPNGVLLVYGAAAEVGLFCWLILRDRRANEAAPAVRQPSITSIVLAGGAVLAPVWFVLFRASPSDKVASMALTEQLSLFCIAGFALSVSLYRLIPAIAGWFTAAMTAALFMVVAVVSNMALAGSIGDTMSILIGLGVDVLLLAALFRSLMRGASQGASGVLIALMWMWAVLALVWIGAAVALATVAFVGAEPYRWLIAGIGQILILVSAWLADLLLGPLRRQQALPQRS